MISRQLCARPEIDNHWTLRDYAGKLLVQLCKYICSISAIFVIRVPSLREYTVCDMRQRVLRLLKRVFYDVASSHAMIYGVFYPLYELSTINEVSREHCANIARWQLSLQRAAIQVRFQTLCTEARLKCNDLTAPQLARIDAERLHALLTVRDIRVPPVEALVERVVEVRGRDEEVRREVRECNRELETTVL
jgi:hypothetical protein